MSSKEKAVQGTFFLGSGESVILGIFKGVGWKLYGGFGNGFGGNEALEEIGKHIFFVEDIEAFFFGY